jgi:hypothetical protein
MSHSVIARKTLAFRRILQFNFLRHKGSRGLGFQHSRIVKTKSPLIARPLESLNPEAIG